MHIIWNCRLPSPRVRTVIKLLPSLFFALQTLCFLTFTRYFKQCVAIDAVVEVDLVSALQVSVFPEVIFTKSGKILHRENGNFLIETNGVIISCLCLDL